MKYSLKLVVCLCWLPVLLCATSSPPGDTGGELLVIDDAGREVALPGPAERIVSLSPANTEMLFALDAGDQVVGVTTFCNYPPQAAQKDKIGGYAEISIEAVAGVGPDLVVAGSLHMNDILPVLENLGMKVIIVNPRDIAGVYSSLFVLGQAIGREKECSRLCGELKAEEERIVTAIAAAGQSSPRVFWELGVDLWTAGPGSFVDDLITTAGGQNIAAGADSPWVQLSAEVIIQENPEVIFLADHLFGENIRTVSSRPGWDTLSAVKNGGVIEIEDVDLVSRPGPRMIEALVFIASVLHPEIFE